MKRVCHMYFTFRNCCPVILDYITRRFVIGCFNFKGIIDTSSQIPFFQVVGLTWVTTRVAEKTDVWWPTSLRRFRMGLTTSAAVASICAMSTSQRTSRRPAPPHRSPSVRKHIQHMLESDYSLPLTATPPAEFELTLGFWQGIHPSRNSLKHNNLNLCSGSQSFRTKDFHNLASHKRKLLI